MSLDVFTWALRVYFYCQIKSSSQSPVDNETSSWLFSRNAPFLFSTHGDRWCSGSLRTDRLYSNSCMHNHKSDDARRPDIQKAQGFTVWHKHKQIKCTHWITYAHINTQGGNTDELLVPGYGEVVGFHTSWCLFCAWKLSAKIIRGSACALIPFQDPLKTQLLQKVKGRLTHFITWLSISHTFISLKKTYKRFNFSICTHKWLLTCAARLRWRPCVGEQVTLLCRRLCAACRAVQVKGRKLWKVCRAAGTVNAARDTTIRYKTTKTKKTKVVSGWLVLNLYMQEEAPRCYYSKWRNVIWGWGKRSHHTLYRCIPCDNYVLETI